MYLCTYDLLSGFFIFTQVHCIVVLCKALFYILQTSISMEVLLFNLANNPEKQSKLHQEISGLHQPGEPATAESLKKMPYLKACIKESMRYFCPQLLF